MIHTEHVVINKTENEVFRYLKKEENHPSWGVNFLKNYKKTAEGHFVDTPMGRVNLEIKAYQETGVVDILLGGRPTHSRVISLTDNQTLYIFTLVLPDEMPKSEIDKGLAGLKEEMGILKSILETS